MGKEKTMGNEKVKTRKTHREAVADRLREFSLKSQDIVKVADFGAFEVIITKRGAMFRTHTGFHVWCSPYVLGLDGKACEASLYAWLKNLADAKELFPARSGEAYPDAGGATYGDILDYMRIVTEANMTYPLVAFTDIETAAGLASQRISQLGALQESLAAAMGAAPPEETAEDLRRSFEEAQGRVGLEKAASLISGGAIVNGNAGEEV